MTYREEDLQPLIDKGKTREQAIAFLDILGSAFRRKGWVDGEPLTQDELGERLDTFLDDDGATS